MIAGRYLNVVLTVIALSLAVIAVRPWLPAPESAHAQQATPKYELAVPKSWGKLIHFSNNNLLLEDREGNLRIVDVEGRAPEYPRVRSLIRFR
jgi:hypothetical protein